MGDGESCRLRAMLDEKCIVCGERHSGQVGYASDGALVVRRDPAEKYCRGCGCRITNEVWEVDA